MRYGTSDQQFIELWAPQAGTPRGCAILIHCGYWRAVHDATIMHPLAGDLVARGWAVANIEYRRVGNGGGWPATLADVRASPIRQLPVDVPLLIIHGDVDVRVPEAHSADFAVAAVAPHRDIDYSKLPGLGRMDDIDHTAPHWPVAVDWMERRNAESRATDRWAGTG